MALDFPSSPTNGQTFTSGSRTWVYNSTTSSWEAYSPTTTISANYVFAAPNGSSGLPTFRSLVAADLPSTAVTAGSYTLANVTIDAQGRITSASSGNSVTGDFTAGGALVSTNSIGDEGGEIRLAKATTNTTLTTSVTIDVYQNKLRIFETGGTNRGVYIDLSTASATVGTNLLSSTGVTSVTGTAPIVSSGGTTPAISISAATTTAAGSMSAADKTKLDGIASGATANTGTVTSVGLSVPTGLTVAGSPVTTSGTLAITLTAGYSIPTTASQTNWDTAYTDRNKWDGGATGLTAATGRTSLGATTVGGNLFTLTNPTAITFLRVNADNTVSALDAATFRTAIGAGTSSTTGTVTSVGGTGTVSGLTLTGTVTTTGNLTLGGTLSVTPSNFASQTANTFLAAPNGAAGAPTFRAIVAADIPTLNQNTTGSAATATTATNQSGGTVSATTGAFSGTMTLPTGAGSNYIKAGTGDGASFTTYNLKINSWWGIGFGDYQDLTTVKAYIDCRTGNIATSGQFVGPGTGLTGTASSLTAGAVSSITSSQVTTALGFTPYNSTNPSGYITGISSGNVTTALGYTPTRNDGTALIGQIQVANATASADVFNGGIMIREVNNVANAQTGYTYAPGITFHWSMVGAAQLYMNSSGEFVFGAQTDKANVRGIRAGTVYSNGVALTSNTGTVTSVATGTGLTGGTITTSGTISLANTTVTAGSYTAANITVDAQGRITAASNGSAGYGAATLRNVTSGYTGGGQVFVQTATPTASAAGDVWLDISGTDGYTQNLASAGYTKLPNGFQMVWGSIYLSQDTSGTVTLYTAMPTAILHVFITGQGSINTGGGGSDVFTILSTSTFTLSHGSDPARTMSWMAIGY